MILFKCSQVIPSRYCVSDSISCTSLRRLPRSSWKPGCRLDYTRRKDSLVFVTLIIASTSCVVLWSHYADNIRSLQSMGQICLPLFSYFKFYRNTECFTVHYLWLLLQLNRAQQDTTEGIVHEPTGLYNLALYGQSLSIPAAKF